MNKLNKFDYIDIKNKPFLIDKASFFFSSKWGIDINEYKKCISDYINGKTDLGRFIALDNETIIGGLGVIENDFHNEKELTPNICAVYVNEEYRGLKVAGTLLKVCLNDLKDKGYKKVYLLTNLVGFYEQYGFTFLKYVKGNFDDFESRMYEFTF